MVRVSRKSVLDARHFRKEVIGTKDPLTLFQKILSDGRAYLKNYHNCGASPATILLLNTWLIDNILTTAWDLLTNAKIDHQRASLLAVGGYGRKELHPQSDIDLMIILQNSPNAAEIDFVERYIRFLWDIGLQVGHSVRTLEECSVQARKDATILTNMIESRYLYGNINFENLLHENLDPSKMWKIEDFFNAKKKEQEARHHFYNDTGYNLEPHVKEGPGGLRDIQTITWIAQRHFGSRDLTKLVMHNFLTNEECRMLIRGRNFLWKIRNSLHFLANRKEDRLLFDYQMEIAREFNYLNDKKSLAVEKLMKRYYRTVKELMFLNDLLLQYFSQEIISKKSKNIFNINSRFRSVNGLIETKHANVFKNSPFALLEIFLLLQKRSDLTGIQASTIRQLWSNRKLLNSTSRKHIRCRQIFMEILRAPSGQIHALRRMNDYGILGSYIPAFGRVVGQMQHDLFHFFTVDAHLLIVVRNLRRLEIKDYDHELPFVSSLMKNIYKRHRLFIAALFHDIAKGRGGDHSVLGERTTYNFCRLHNLGQYDAKFIAWLVRHHLSMSWIAQREDISEPETIGKFANLVGSQERLDNLYVLTVADIRGTNPDIWNDWKGQLLFDLYIATSRALQRGINAPIELKEQINDIKNETLALLSLDQSTLSKTKLYWDSLETDYFFRYRPEFIAWHTELLLSSDPNDMPLISAKPLSKSATAQFLICAPDSRWLLSSITASFDREGINIVDARVHKNDSGIAVMIFVVLMQSDIDTDPVLLTERCDRIRSRILNRFEEELNKNNQIAPRLKHFPIETEVFFRTSLDESYITMEVRAQDRPGLLNQVANTLLECKVVLINARISTFGERAEDIFLLKDQETNEFISNEKKICLVNAIKRALP